MTDEWAEVSNPGGRKSLRRGALCACVMLAMQEVSSCMHRDVTLRQYHMVRRYENVAMNVLEERKSRDWECAYVTDYVLFTVGLLLSYCHSHTTGSSPR